MIRRDFIATLACSAITAESAVRDLQSQRRFPTVNGMEAYWIEVVAIEPDIEVRPRMRGLEVTAQIELMRAWITFKAITLSGTELWVSGYYDSQPGRMLLHNSRQVHVIDFVH